MTILKDTSLCAIVRDEKMNPAGGIERFLRCHLPYIEEAVVLDTGSTDGTREILDKMAKEFAHLKVYDSLFGGYSFARNISLKHVKTAWALVLDADELIEPKSFDVINSELGGVRKKDGISFALKNVFSEDEEISYDALHNPRFFSVKKGFKYCSEGKFSEYLFNSRGNRVCDFGNIIYMPASCPIIHFQPSAVGFGFKSKNWYGKIGKMDIASFGPSQTSGFDEWKKLNPQRASYFG